MKHLTFKYNNKKSYKSAVKKALKGSYSSQLIQIFTSEIDTKKISSLLKKLTSDFPNAIIIGTTTAGEISHAKMYDDSTIISLSLFKTTKLSVKYVKNINTKSGQKLSKTICSKYTKAAIVLSEGLTGEDYEGFVKGIKDKNNKLIIAGGLAGDNFKLKNTYIFLGDKLYNKGAVAVSFSGKYLFADNKYNLNWTPIGKEFTITSVDGNIVHQIDNVNAVEVFEKYLGKEIFNDNAKALPDFQLLYKEGETIVARTPLTVDGKSLVFAGNIKEGQVVQFGFSNASNVVSGSDSLGKTIQKKPAEAIFIYSCIARKTLLGKVLENEFSSFEHIAPTAGFFTYGEFYSTNTTNALLNCTTTILILSESKKKSNKSNKKRSKNNTLDSITFNALTHFVEQTSQELNENVELLNQYKNVVDKVSLVSKTDANGYITYVNNNFCKISGYTKEELMGKNHNIVRNPETSSFIFKKMWKTIKSGKIWRGFLSNKAKDGSIYYIEATIMPILDKEHNIVEFIAIRQDITKQIQSKKRVQEKERLIKAIFDNQDSIVIHASKTKGMQYVNKKLFDYFNYENFEDFKNQHKCLCELFLEEQGYVSQKQNPDWLDIIADDTENKDYKVKMKIKDGSIHTFTIAIKKIDDDYIINLYDITTLEAALIKANSSEQAKSMFLSNMSHEIRTPLNGILGFTDILSKKELDKDTARYIDIIHKSGQTLLNVVNDILDFSKIESGELSLYKTESNLFEEMEAAVSTFSSVSKSNHIEYYTFIDPTIPKVLKCDIQRIKQVINNLISNAMKFTPENGSVKVDISLKEIKDGVATIHFSVKDSGIGIEKDKLPSIFKAFSQADNSISREFGGTGLGLAISNRYINMMGSNIEVESEVGKGSRFFFDIELDIVDSRKSLEKSDSSRTLNIDILYSRDDSICTINKNVAIYLKEWQCNYKEIFELDEISKDINILIVCAKLFDKEKCEAILDKYPSLQLLYIEGIEDNFSCSHERFHMIEQPMTGSAIYDKLISFSTLQSVSTEDEDEDQNSDTSYKGNILIAEDNETNQMLISIMLEERDINFDIAVNGQEAIDMVEEHDNYDLIFMDINMPILDGLTAIKILRERNYTKPIVSLSANVIEKDKLTFIEAGVDDTLNKPVVASELDKILTKYLTKELQKNNIVVDTIDIEDVGRKLSINNNTIVLKLLNSFLASAKEMIKTLENQDIDKHLAHTIKGVSGNLRLKHLYDLVINFEQELDNWSEDDHKMYKNALLYHLEELIKQIELLNK